MGSIQTAIELQDNFTGILMNVINAVNMSVSTMHQMQETMSSSVDTSSIEGIREHLNQATIAAQQLGAAMQHVKTPDTSSLPQPQWQTYGGIEVFTSTGMERSEQEIASVNSMMEQLSSTQYKITQQSNETEIISPQAAYDIQNVENRVSQLSTMIEQATSNPLNVGSDSANAGLERLREQLNQTLALQDNLNQAMQGMDTGQINAAYLQLSQSISNTERLVRDSFSNIPPVEVPITWNSDNLEVFTGSGIERFEQEVQSTNNMLTMLNQTQAQIAARAAQTNIFPPNMVTDMNGMQNRLQAIQSRIQAIENNPLNMGTDEANAELEQLRAQLHQAVQQQELMNQAVENMDVQAANEAYMKLSQIVGSTEKHIRDNVDEQGRLTHEIEKSTDGAAQLKSMISKAVGAFAGMAGLKKAKQWIDDCTAAFNTQYNAELQLVNVLSNMIDEDYVAQFEVEVNADTTMAVDEINSIQDEVKEVTVSVSAESKALTAAYDQITAKASEIQGRGIYGDEAMIAAAAEFSTYFSDVNAVEMMMDTLADYTMGMTGGGAVDVNGMVNYATNLGKIMSGSYDAMSKKGFEFTDVQKAIIEGEATREQIVTALGEEYVDMSSDMQAAAAISQVIDEAWEGLYENMSNTPEGKIIQMTNTFGDMKEVIGGQLYPYVILFVDAITENWGTIQTVLDGITKGLQFLLGFLSWLVEGAFNFVQVIIDNWSWISPIIYGIVAAIAVYYGWQLATNVINLVSKGIHFAMAAAQMIHAAATKSLTEAKAKDIAAQNGLNASMAACPIMWIIIAIVALIAVVYAVVGAINHFAGTSISATGVIMGAFAVLGAFILNTFVIPVWNKLASFANFIGNFVNDPIAAVKVLFYDMCLSVIGYIQNMAHAIENLINKIPGVTIDITSGLDKFYSELEQAQQAVKDESGWVEYVKKLDYIDYGDAWNAGYAFGERIDESIENFDPSSLFKTEEIPPAEDLTKKLADGGIGNSVDDIAENTGDIADSMDITEEDLKYLRDIAEQDTVNRFTTAEIKIEQNNQNTVSDSMDIDGFFTYLTDAVNEAVETIAEGVHA